MVKYKKIPNNENAIEIDGKVVLSFDTRYKEYLKWRDENPDLEQLLVYNLKQEIKNKELYNNGAPHTGSNSWSWYNEDGKLCLESEMDGVKKDGEEKAYYDNGNKSLERSVVNGIKKKIEYHENGRKKLDEETYDDGGRCLIHYDRNGQHYRKINYNKDGRKNGPYINYGKNGNKILEASYLNDKEHGKWIYYSDDGKILKEEIKNTN